MRTFLLDDYPHQRGIFRIPYLTDFSASTLYQNWSITLLYIYTWKHDYNDSHFNHDSHFSYDSYLSYDSHFNYDSHFGHDSHFSYDFHFSYDSHFSHDSHFNFDMETRQRDQWDKKFFFGVDDQLIRKFL